MSANQEIYEIAFVGGGFGLVAHLEALERQLSQEGSTTATRVWVIDPRAKGEGLADLGKGEPYDVAVNDLTHNLPTTVMGAVPVAGKDWKTDIGFHGDFTAWLKTNKDREDLKGYPINDQLYGEHKQRHLIDFSDEDLASLKAPRQLHGIYLQERLGEVLQRLKDLDNVEVIAVPRAASHAGAIGDDDRRAIHLQASHGQASDEPRTLVAARWSDGSTPSIEEGIRAHHTVAEFGFALAKPDPEVADVLLRNVANQERFAALKSQVAVALDTQEKPRALILGAMNSGIDAVLLIRRAVEEYYQADPYYKEHPNAPKKSFEITMVSRERYQLRHLDASLYPDFQRTSFTYAAIVEALIAAAPEVVSASGDPTDMHNRELQKHLRDLYSDEANRPTLEAILLGKLAEELQPYVEDLDSLIAGSTLEGRFSKELVSAVIASEKAWLIFKDFWLDELNGLWNLLPAETQRRVLEYVKPIWDKLDTSVPWHVQEFMLRAQEAADPVTGIHITSLAADLKEIPVIRDGDGVSWNGEHFNVAISALGPRGGGVSTHPFFATHGIGVPDALGGLQEIDTTTHRLKDAPDITLAGASSSLSEARVAGHYAPSLLREAYALMQVIVEEIQQFGRGKAA